MRLVTLVLTSFVFACVPAAPEDAGTSADAGQSAALQWWATCGDPVCSSFTAPTDVSSCSVVEGAACTSAGQECYLEGDECNRRLRCADEDPTQQPGGCPISLPAAKHDIRYLGHDEREALADEVLAVRLASWRYRGASDAPRLGILLDESAPAHAVLPNGRQVDVYGYTSLAVAALQVQQEELDRLRVEVSALREQVKTLAAATKQR